MQMVGYESYLKMLGRQLPNSTTVTGWRAQPATDAQIAALRKFGIAGKTIKNRGDASFVINLAATRANQGLASPGQLKLLIDLRVENAANKTRTEVQIILNSIGYTSRCPEWVRAQRG